MPKNINATLKKLPQLQVPEILDLIQKRKKALKTKKIIKMPRENLPQFLGSYSTKTWIPNLYFDLVESGEYINYPWDNEYFRLMVELSSHKLKNDSSSFKFVGFHLALQIWLYECCQKVDTTIAIRIPRIFN